MYSDVLKKSIFQRIDFWTDSIQFDDNRIFFFPVYRYNWRLPIAGHRAYLDREVGPPA